MKKSSSSRGTSKSNPPRAGLSGLSAQYRNGQVFLQWRETGLSPEARLTVWGSSKPITEKNCRFAEKLADRLNSNSSEDWWRDVSSFVVTRPDELKSEEIFAGRTAERETGSPEKQGFVIRDGGKPIPVGGGLHVHTPMTQEETGNRYYAVTCRDRGKAAGFTTLRKPVAVRMAPIRPIRIADSKMPRGSGKGLPMLIILHGRGGGVGVDSLGRPLGTHLFFADRTLGWREGLPFKFSVEVRPDRVDVTFYDRVWIGRILSPKEQLDVRDGVKAISTFWMGYHPRISESLLGPDFICDNYTERLLIYLIHWIRDYFQTDPDAVYITGGSMGGTGAVQLATHFPEEFAAVRAQVPICAYTWKPSQIGGNTSVWRIQCSCGKFSRKDHAKMPDDTDLLRYLDGARSIARSETDMPAIFASCGRQDKSMPWANNPPFFEAADRARQFLSVYWSDGDHNMSADLPDDVKQEQDPVSLFRFRRNAPWPVFSSCSDNRNYGSGDVADGDIVGWMNRGIRWQTLADEPDRFRIKISMAYPGIRYPVTADVTIRRRQKFLPKPGETVLVKIDGSVSSLKIRKDGLLTIPGVRFSGKKYVTLEITRKKTV